MNKLDIIYIYHIRDSIKKIIDYSEGINEPDFKNRTIIQDAVIRQIEIIGEASSKLSAEFKKKFNNIPWKNIIGMRNKLIHDYFGVNINSVWKTIKLDIPFLKIEIDKIIEQSDPVLDIFKN
jgi:uncharacterized protein with HEPN domain